MDFLKSAEGEILSRYFSFFRIVYFLLDLEKILLVEAQVMDWEVIGPPYGRSRFYWNLGLKKS